MLTGLGLITPAQLTECQAAVGSRTDSSALLEMLQRRQYLTSYQVSRIEKGETAGLVLGNCRVLYRVGSGTFARVFRAQNGETGATVALKVLRERWNEVPNIVAGFRREAQVCRRFNHRNIVRIHEVSEDKGFHFLTMEFVEGGTLRDILKIRKLMEPVNATRCLLDICNGLEYALEQGTTHRDIRTTNVLMSSDGVAKLVDFGLAGADSQTAGIEGSVTGQALEYSALERGTNATACDPRTDLFFAGAVYYELLTGRPPWPHTRDRAERKRLARYSSMMPVGRVDSQLPDFVTRIADRLLQFSPNERYQNVTEVITDLQRALASLDSAVSVEETLRDTHQSDEPSQAVGNTILFVESRDEQRDIVKRYFAEQGFRVLLVSYPENAMKRINSAAKPDCVVFMAESIGNDAAELFQRALDAARPWDIPCLLIVSREQARDWLNRLAAFDPKIVLTQPVTLKRLRVVISDRLAKS